MGLIVQISCTLQFLAERILDLFGHQLGFSFGEGEVLDSVLMGSLLPIITRSIIGNNGFIITYYLPGQLEDAI